MKQSQSAEQITIASQQMKPGRITTSPNTITLIAAFTIGHVKLSSSAQRSKSKLEQ